MAINIEARAGIYRQVTVDGSVLKDREPIDNLVVMKFGGTSVGSAQSIEKVTGIIEKYQRDGIPIVVVVSAMSSVTNKLQELAGFVQSENPQNAENKIRELEERHRDVCRSLNMPSSICKLDLEYELSELFAELREVSKSGVFDSEKVAKILSYGERLSARILGRRLGLRAQIVDSSDIVYTDDNFLNATADLSRTQIEVRHTVDPLLKRGFIPIVTGFIGTTIDGKITLLGRNSSDYSATLIGGSLGAREVWFWKDVDGIYDKGIHDTDSRLVSELSCDKVKNIPEGTKVVHEKALEALKVFRINGRVKNTFNPDALGTLITYTSQLPTLICPLKTG